MRTLRYILAIVLAAVMLLNSASLVTACGPVTTDPVYVSKESPDPPFQEFTNGKIGIVKESFGRKTLFIAYRYLNGGSFTPDEQNDLVAALKGTGNDTGGAEAIKAWMAARDEFLKEDQKPEEIYTEKSYGGYDYFPNCAANAFEVATQTLKERSATYGADDKSVGTWLEAQDAVFDNCSGEPQIPVQLGSESPKWLRKDRDYQIAAAYFYSLKFDEARARFERIAADADSPWQPIAGYLVARTLIRQGSLGNDEKKKRELFEQAETRLQTLVRSGGKYENASKKLLALVRYQIHPAERVVELSRILTSGSNDNLRQDLIDFTWLLDKFEHEIGTAEEERKQEEVSPGNPQPPYAPFLSEEAKDRFERVQAGETIELAVFEMGRDGNPDYNRRIGFEFKHNAPEAEIFQRFAQKFGRELRAEEVNAIKEALDVARKHRQWRISPNRKWDFGGLSLHDRCEYKCTKFNLDLVPEFLRSDDLSDWILTLQIEDSRAYGHAFTKWRETGSTAWMTTALIKADTSSPNLRRLMQAAERVSRNDPAFPTVAYHLIRLRTAMGQTDQARTLSDEIITSHTAALPVSALNQFLEQRMHLAAGLNDFLKSAQRTPIAFFLDGRFGKFSQILQTEKGYWSVESGQTKEDFEHQLDESYKHLLPWDNRVNFDQQTVDIFNWHFPLQLLAEAARNPNVPDYLQRSLVLAAWTRAILLKNDELALKLAPEVIRVEPQMASELEPYLKAGTAKDRQNNALYVLLKFANLSPFVQGGPTTFKTAEELEYYLESTWWCKLETTEYTGPGKETPKVVPKPKFLTAAQLETARQEFLALATIGDGMSYLGKQAIEWAKASPDDPRVPEALFIAVQANQSFKYGCNSWEFDAELKAEAEKLLRERYPESPWTAKLAESQ